MAVTEGRMNLEGARIRIPVEPSTNAVFAEGVFSDLIGRTVPGQVGDLHLKVEEVEYESPNRVWLVGTLTRSEEEANANV